MKIAFPPVNIAREEESFIVSLAVPGYDKNDFSISAENGLLSVSAKHDESLEEKTDDYLHHGSVAFLLIANWPFPPIRWKKELRRPTKMACSTSLFPAGRTPRMSSPYR